jgi:hypothetical protein
MTTRVEKDELDDRSEALDGERKERKEKKAKKHKKEKDKRDKTERRLKREKRLLLDAAKETERSSRRNSMSIPMTATTTAANGTMKDAVQETSTEASSTTTTTTTTETTKTSSVSPITTLTVEPKSNGTNVVGKITATEYSLDALELESVESARLKQPSSFASSTINTTVSTTATIPSQNGNIVGTPDRTRASTSPIPGGMSKNCRISLLFFSLTPSHTYRPFANDRSECEAIDDRQWQRTYLWHQSRRSECAHVVDEQSNNVGFQWKFGLVDGGDVDKQRGRRRYDSQLFVEKAIFVETCLLRVHFLNFLRFCVFALGFTPVPDAFPVEPHGHPKYIAGYVGVMSRVEAEEALRGKVFGTFLIRWSDNNRFFVVSYVSRMLRISHMGDIHFDRHLRASVLRVSKSVVLYASFEDFLKVTEKEKETEKERKKEKEKKEKERWRKKPRKDYSFLKNMILYCRKCVVNRFLMSRSPMPMCNAGSDQQLLQLFQHMKLNNKNDRCYLNVLEHHLEIVSL